MEEELKVGINVLIEAFWTWLDVVKFEVSSGIGDLKVQQLEVDEFWL